VKDNIIIWCSWPIITFPKWDYHKFFSCFIYYLGRHLKKPVADVGFCKFHAKTGTGFVKRSMLFSQ